jgi:hypothetical protein
VWNREVKVRSLRRERRCRSPACRMERLIRATPFEEV